jgi:thiamine biosynthesis lipoprotein
MATRFEIVLHGPDAPGLRAAGEEALGEIERLEAQLSLYRPSSEIAQVNARAHAGPVRVTPAVFHLLEHARRLADETGGAFDITVAPLVRCWGFMGGTGAMPDPEAVAEARGLVGMDRIELNPADYTVRFTRRGVMIDLGAIGKGYAIDRAAWLLREAGVTSALIHGGTSSSFAIGRPPDAERWKVAIASPSPDPAARPLAVVELADESLSVSAVWGRSFQAGERTFGHVIDPRTGMPSAQALLTAAVLPSATEGDALTTAMLTEPALMPALVEARPGMRALVLAGTVAAPEIHARGISVLAPPAA